MKTMITRRKILAATFAAAFAATTLGPAMDVAQARQLHVDDVARMINSVRAKHGLRPIRFNLRLQVAAEKHAALMARKQKMSHSLGGSLRSRTRAVGFKGRTGENLAAGQKRFNSVVRDWMKSPGHRKNLLNPRFTEFGIAFGKPKGGRYGIYWALVMGG